MAKKPSKRATVAKQTVTISTQTARIAQQALNKLVGGDGRSKMLIGQAEVELEKVLGTTSGAQAGSNGTPSESSDGVAGAAAVGA